MPSPTPANKPPHSERMRRTLREAHYQTHLCRPHHMSLRAIGPTLLRRYGPTIRGDPPRIRARRRRGGWPKAPGRAKREAKGSARRALRPAPAAMARRARSGTLHCQQSLYPHNVANMVTWHHAPPGSGMPAPTIGMAHLSASPRCARMHAVFDRQRRGSHRPDGCAVGHTRSEDDRRTAACRSGVSGKEHECPRFRNSSADQPSTA